MKKFITLLFLSPTAFSDVIRLDMNMDDIQVNQFQILCVFSSKIEMTGFQYLYIEKLTSETGPIIGKKLYIDNDSSTLTQMLGENGKPISCSRPVNEK